MITGDYLKTLVQTYTGVAGLSVSRFSAALIQVLRWTVFGGSL